MANQVIFKTGQVIFREGDEPIALYVIRSGKVRITRGEVVLDELGRNAFFGEMSLIDEAPRSATATAAEETECVEISGADFQKRLHNLDPVMQGIFRVMVERMRRLDRTLAGDDAQRY